VSTSTVTVADALAEAQRAGLDRLDAHLLLAHVLDRPRTWLIAHDDQPLDAAHQTRWAALLARRRSGEPVAYLLGEKEFHGLALRVTPDVLVPRPDTETLVDWALALLQSGLGGESPTVADLGTGSGAIALAIRHRHPAAQVTATDFSPAALAVARDNAARLRLPVRFALGDWWQPLAGERFALAVSNPPYIAGDDAHLTALTHEPTAALTPGGDGLDAIRQIAASAAGHLLPGGWLLFEHGHDQADAVQALLTNHGFEAVRSERDLAGIARCTGGRWRG
jgi:release factor glutamine methyltransferase